MPRHETECVRKRKQLVLEVLRRRGVATLEDLVEELRKLGDSSASKWNVYYVLRKLVNEGAVTIVHAGSRALYRLAAAEPEQHEPSTTLQILRTILGRIYDVVQRSRGTLVCISVSSVVDRDNQREERIWRLIVLPKLRELADLVGAESRRERPCFARENPLCVLATMLDRDEFVKVLEDYVTGRMARSSLEKLTYMLRRLAEIGKLEKRPYAYVLKVQNVEEAKARLREVCEEYEEVTERRVVCNGLVVLLGEEQSSESTP